MSDLRIPFSIAISEPRLLGNRWKEFSLPQQVVLKAAYGLELSDSRKDARHWSELDYFAAFLGFGEFDDLGYLRRVDRERAPAYAPQEFAEVWLNEGVRSGKSTLASFVICYEATCGGHEALVRPGRRLYCFQIAQDLRQARYALHDIKANLESMPFMLEAAPGGKPRIEAVTADRIDIWNGVTIAVTPPTVKSVRGYDSPASVLDEVGVWYQEADSANPDFEIHRQVKSRQAQFGEFGKIWGISSPWGTSGLLYERWQAGTNGMHVRCAEHQDLEWQEVRECPDCREAQRPYQNRLVLTCPTAAMGNPLVTKSWLVDYRATDQKAFERECLAKFAASISGYFDEDAIRQCVDKGVREREPDPKVTYVAAMDPAFKRDIFAFGVAHMDAEGRVVIDRQERWRRQSGESPLNPGEILARIAEICKLYKIHVVAQDQYQNESMTVLAQQRGLAVREINFQSGTKAELYGSVASLVNQRKVRLLDRATTIQELVRLERKLLPGGEVKLTAPTGQTDDEATVIALLVSQALWLGPPRQVETNPYAAPDPEPPTPQELIARQVAQKWQVATAPDSLMLDPWD